MVSVMTIAGLVRSSLIDFPGRVTAVVFTPGCNFRCPFCHNADLAWSRIDGTMVPTESGLPEGGGLPGGHAPSGKPVLLDENEVLAFLRRRAGKLGGVVISGGEPTLQPDLALFLEKLRGLGLAIKLDTNGSRPDMLAAILARGLVDMIAMDIKGTRADYAELTGLGRDALPWPAIERSIALIAADARRQTAKATDSARPEFRHEFRTTVMEPHFDETAIRELRAFLPPGVPWRLQAFTGKHGMLDASFAGCEPAPADLARYRDIAAG